jgi:hypothetical protein
MTAGQSTIDRVAVFSRRREFDKANALFSRLQLPFEVGSPEPAYSGVGVPALICDTRGLGAIHGDRTIICSGWTEYFKASVTVPEKPAETFDEDVFGETVIMFFGPYMADQERVRLTAHLTGDLTEVLPYINSTMPRACFNPGPDTLSFMDGARMVTLYSRRIAIGKRITSSTPGKRWRKFACW